MFLPILRILFTLLFISSASLYASTLSLGAEVLVNNVELSWSPVEGAAWYDIYSGSDFIVRLPEGECTYTLSHLDQEADYRFVMGARDSANNTLDAEAVRVRTGSYSGTYTWTNPTDRDNDGKMRSLTYTATLREDAEIGQYLEISMRDDDGLDHTIFPLQPLGSSWSWVDYDDEGPVATAYRVNCEKFNVLPISPSRFRVESMAVSGDSITVEIVSSALGVNVSTFSTYLFAVDDEGPYLSFTTEGNGLARSALFKNPADRENPYTYILRPVV